MKDEPAENSQSGPTKGGMAGSEPTPIPKNGSESTVDIAVERQKFEAWSVTVGHSVFGRHNNDEEYVVAYIEQKWQGWLACATKGGKP